MTLFARALDRAGEWRMVASVRRLVHPEAGAEPPLSLARTPCNQLQIRGDQYVPVPEEQE